MTVKILVIGPVEGKLGEVFGKVAALHAKNQFAFALAVGNLFSGIPEDDDSVQDLLTGKIAIPLPTYFALGHHRLPQPVVEKLRLDGTGQVCDNLIFLGKRSTTKTLQGVRIVSLGGQLDLSQTNTSPKDDYESATYSISDARTLHGATTADILLTSDWPAGIAKGSRVDTRGVQPSEQACAAELCSTLKPKYLFSSSSRLYYEREPFFYQPSKEDEDQSYKTTRFLSLAQYGNTDKQKWIYAFNLDLDSPPLVTVPPGTTASPLTKTGNKRPAMNEVPGRWATGANADTDEPFSRKRHKRSRDPPPGPDSCFFCLSNPNVAEHMVVSVGQEAYMTIAKGPVPRLDSFATLQGFSGHLLLMPLAHVATVSDPAATDEMHRYRQAVNTLYARSGLGSVTWEVSRAGGIHAVWQIVPIDPHQIRSGLVETGFNVEAENDKYPSWTTTVEDNDDSDHGDCLNIWLHAPPVRSISTIDNVHEGKREKEQTSSGTEDGDASDIILPAMNKRLVLPLDSTFRFDMQFPRRVVAKLLHLDERIDWKASTESREHETAEAEAFRAAFEALDFSLQ